MSDVKDMKARAQDEPSVEKTSELATGEIRDIAAQLFTEADQITPEELEREGAEVRKILDRRIMPIVGSQCPARGIQLTWLLAIPDILCSISGCA